MNPLRCKSPLESGCCVLPCVHGLRFRRKIRFLNDTPDPFARSALPAIALSTDCFVYGMFSTEPNVRIFCSTKSIACGMLCSKRNLSLVRFNRMFCLRIGLFLEDSCVRPAPGVSVLCLYASLHLKMIPCSVSTKAFLMFETTVCRMVLHLNAFPCLKKTQIDSSVRAFSSSGKRSYGQYCSDAHALAVAISREVDKRQASSLLQAEIREHEKRELLAARDHETPMR